MLVHEVCQVLSDAKHFQTLMRPQYVQQLLHDIHCVI